MGGKRVEVPKVRMYGLSTIHKLQKENAILRSENEGLREVLTKVNALIPENPLFAEIRGLIEAALQSPEDKGECGKD